MFESWEALKTLYPVGISHHDLIDSGAVGEPDHARLRVDLAREALEVAESVEERGRDNENSFLSDGRHGKSFCQA